MRMKIQGWPTGAYLNVERWGEGGTVNSAPLFEVSWGRRASASRISPFFGPDVLEVTAQYNFRFREERLFFVEYRGRTFAVMAFSSEEAWHRSASALVEPGA